MTLAEQAVAALHKNELVLATAESSTGGLIAAKITAVAGCSAVFAGSVCAYANDLKQRLLGVSADTLQTYGAVSPQPAREMAIGIRRLTGASIAIAETGIAGPNGGTAQKPVGLAYIAVCSDAETSVICLQPDSERTYTRAQIQDCIVRNALQFLLTAIEKNEK